MRRTISACLLLLATASLRADDTSDFFNGQDLTGWKGLKEYWSVVDGAIVGKHDGLKFNTFLCSEKTYGDFELSFKVRLKDAKGNSGVQIRSKVVDKEKWVVAGPQADIGAGYWGSLYGEKFGGMMKASSKDNIAKAVKDTEFNDYSIKVVGKHFTIKINGVTMIDEVFEKDGAKKEDVPAEGIIAFQIHAGGPMEVTFKDIQFKNLSK
jgi:hypothetical protein